MGGQPPVFLLGPQHGAELRRGVAAAAAPPVLPLLRRKEATIDRCVASPGDRRFPVNNRKNTGTWWYRLGQNSPVERTRNPSPAPLSSRHREPRRTQTLLFYIQKGISQITFW